MWSGICDGMIAIIIRFLPKIVVPVYHCHRTLTDRMLTPNKAQLTSALLSRGALR